MDGGYLINGLQHYATNASYAEWLWVGLLLEGMRSDIPIMVPANTEGVSIDASGWDPIGMRACVSPQIKLGNVCVPDSYALGKPGMLMANEAKFMAVESVNRFMHLAGQTAGPSLPFKNRPVGRLIRDLHVLHGRQHTTVMCVGQAALGEPYNLNLSV